MTQYHGMVGKLQASSTSVVLASFCLSLWVKWGLGEGCIFMGYVCGMLVLLSSHCIIFSP